MNRERRDGVLARGIPHPEHPRESSVAPRRVRCVLRKAPVGTVFTLLILGQLPFVAYLRAAPLAFIISDSRFLPAAEMPPFFPTVCFFADAAFA